MKQRKTERPILMCSEMVRAILAGKKTETRRMAGLKELNKNPDFWSIDKGGKDDGIYCMKSDIYSDCVVKHNKYGVAGDTLWVRETFAQAEDFGYHAEYIHYKATYINGGCYDDVKKWTPSLFMRKEQSRITLSVKSATLERLHEITDEGAKAEGVTDRSEYERLWKELNGEESWSLNPWVWVVKFEVKEVRK